MKKTLGLLSTVSICLLFAAGAQAGDPAGSWKWKITTPNGDTIETSLKLELKDGSLTGTYANQFGESPIKDASFKDETVAFSVDREMGGNKFTIKYSGKLDGDSIKGSIELPDFGGGGPTKMDWIATRAK
jgi:hypothetical protein